MSSYFCSVCRAEANIEDDEVFYLADARCANCGAYQTLRCAHRDLDSLGGCNTCGAVVGEIDGLWE